MTSAPELEGIKVCAFDAYGTLFDVHSAAAQCRDVLGDDVEPLSQIWRQKQLEYTWLRSLMGGEYEDFWHLTAQALDYAMGVVGLSDPLLRSRLMDIYLMLDAYPEASEVLEALRAAKYRTAILSNGSPSMLVAATRSTGLDHHLDALLSADARGIYKPHPSVYQMVCDHFDVDADAVCFLSSNGWDAAGGAHFGFRVVWINRFGQPPEQLPGVPEHMIRTLDEVLPMLVR